MRDDAIGVFDSGLGGLTGAKRLLQIAPNENIIYLGDTARVPYGVHTKEEIIGYANDDVNFLQRRNVKMIVAMCGTVSSNVPPSRLENLKVPFVGVVDPTVAAAVKATRNKRVGIIGTPATIKSASFANRIKMYDPRIQTVSNGCPELVNLVQAGYVEDDNFVTNKVAREYLAPIKAFGADTLILGCTHFPIISNIISKIMGEDVTLIDSGFEAAKQVMKIIGLKNMERQKPRDKVEYYVTSRPEEFDRVANIFLGKDYPAKSVLADIDS